MEVTGCGISPRDGFHATESGGRKKEDIAGHHLEHQRPEDRI